MNSHDQEQSLVSHLIELRSRLLKAVLCVLVLVVVMFPFAGEIYTLIASPVLSNLTHGREMIATGVLSPFLTPFKMVIILAVMISMPERSTSTHTSTLWFGCFLLLAWLLKFRWPL